MSKMNWDLDESRGYLDLASFKDYMLLVKDALDAVYKRNKRPVTVADIRRELGSQLIDSHLWDALDALCGIGSIAMTSDVSPIKFAPKDIPVKKVRDYNSTAVFAPASKKEWVRYTK